MIPDILLFIAVMGLAAAALLVVVFGYVTWEKVIGKKGGK